MSNSDTKLEFEVSPFSEQAFPPSNSSFYPVRLVGSVKSGSNKHSSMDFSEQIKQLELEGQRLRASAVSLSSLGDSGIASAVDVPELEPDVKIEKPKPVTSAFSPTSIARLADITSEQKTINDLRIQLDNQKKETDRLQQQLVGEYANTRVGSLSQGLCMARFGSPAKPSGGAFSTIPSSELASSLGAPSTGVLTSTRRPFDYAPPSHLEKSLKESQEQVMGLRKRLIETNELAEQQKKQSRLTIEDLKSKLHDTVLNRDRILELRHKEATSQEALVSKLQANVHHLHETSKKQEEVLLETSKKLDCLQHTSYEANSALSQIRLALSDMEQKRAKPFYESKPISKQNTTMLVHTLEKCLQDMEHQLEIRQIKLGELQCEVTEVKRLCSHGEQTLIKEHQDRVSQLISEHEKQFEAATERANNARQQSVSLQSQLDVLEEQHEHQMRIQHETISAQERKLKVDKKEFDEDREKWNQRREALEQSLDHLQKELAEQRSLREQVVTVKVAMETKMNDCQERIGELECELNDVSEENDRLVRAQEEQRRCKEELERRLIQRDREMEQLERMLDMVKHESDIHIQAKVATVEKMEKERAMEQISTLSSQLASAAEISNKSSLDLELTRTEVNTLKLQVTKLTDQLRVTTAQLSAVTEQKEHTTSELDEQKADCDKFSKEKQYYVELVETKNLELGTVKAERDRLVIQLEENDKNVKTLYQQSSNLSQMVEINSKASENVREEKEKLLQMLTEKGMAIEEIRLSRDTAVKKLKLREKRLKELEDEREKIVAESEHRRREVKIIQEEKDAILREYTQNKYEVAQLTEQRTKLQKALIAQKTDLENQVKKLSAKLKATEQDSKLAQKALRTKDSVDNKAVKMADRMQKEVTSKRGQIDHLQSQLHWLEEKIDALDQHRKGLEADNDQLLETVKRLSADNCYLSEQLESYQAQHQDLISRASKLQSGLEKAAVKNASAQTQVEQVEQEIARLKLNHQLELKEAHSSIGSGNHVSNFSQSPTLHVPHTAKENQRSQGGHYTPQISPATTQNHLETFAEVGVELKALLTELKNMISAQKVVSHTPAQKATPGAMRDNHMKCQWEREADRMRGLTKAEQPYQDQEVKKPARSSPSLDQVHGQPLMVTRGYHHLSANRNSRSQAQGQDGVLYLSGISNIPERDITESVEKGGMEQSDTSLWTTNSSTSHIISQPMTSSPLTKHKGSAVMCQTTNVIPLTDTRELCKRLEQKMKSLSEMGGCLQRENKEMADLIKVQGKKLKRVKDSEKRVHRKR